MCFWFLFFYYGVLFLLLAFAMMGWGRFESLWRLLCFCRSRSGFGFWDACGTFVLKNGELKLWLGISFPMRRSSRRGLLESIWLISSSILLFGRPGYFSAMLTNLLGYWAVLWSYNIMWPYYSVKWSDDFWDLVCFLGSWRVKSLKLVFILHIFLLIVHFITIFCHTGPIITLINIYGRKTLLSRAEHTNDRIWRQVILP